MEVEEVQRLWPEAPEMAFNLSEEEILLFLNPLHLVAEQRHRKRPLFILNVHQDVGNESSQLYQHVIS